MKCSECHFCKRGYFPSKPLGYVCTGVKNPFVIDNIEHECTEYPKTGIVLTPIKDSGSTTEFDTGAHRDARGGKGRCDLLPLEVVANYVCEYNDDTDRVLWGLREFQKTNSTTYLYSALNAFDARHWDNCYTMMLEVAKHYEEGGKKYGDNNWKRGMPSYIYIDSAIRHYLKWLRGDTDENHDVSFVWNVMCCIWEVDYGDEWRRHIANNHTG